MSANRFFVPKSSFEGRRVRLSPEQAHQICHVLRLKPGEPIVVLDNEGTEYDVTLTTLDLQETAGEVVRQRPVHSEPAIEVVLFQSLLAREKFEWVLQKGTEVGVTRFVPVMTQRSIVRAKRVEEKKLARWEKILVEAAEQAHRGRVPRLDHAVRFDRIVEHLDRFDRCMIAVPGDGTSTLRKALGSHKQTPSSVALLIGPEGGFTPEEVESARAGGAVPINLGPRVLRTETAAVVASALILHELGQMEP
jgi:16S rRNA (uracil1498-N3)-methyltransferase